MKSLLPLLLLASTTISVLAVTTHARAAPGESAAAEELFERGQRAMDASEIDKACALFTESLRIDAAVGTLFNLASCEEKQGKVASAWEHLREGLRQLRRGDPRAAIATSKLQALEARLPYVTVTLTPEAPKGTRAERDGVELSSVTLGLELPVNPGEHVVVASAPGFLPKRFVIIAKEGQRQSVAVAAGAPEPHAPAPQDMTAGPPRSSTPRTIAWITGGTGLAALGVGVVGGIMAITNANDVRANCSSDGTCLPAGIEAHKRTSDWATVSTIGLISGVALIGTSAVLFLTSKDPAARASSTARGPTVTANGAAWTF